MELDEYRDADMMDQLDAPEDTMMDTESEDSSESEESDESEESIPRSDEELV